MGKTNGSKEEKLALLDRLQEYIGKCNKDQNICILGDFNYVTSTLDRNSSKYTVNDDIYKTKWDTIEIEAELVDCFRKTYKNRRLYSFSSSAHAKSRIDRIYISNKSSGKVECTYFESSDASDHKIVRVKLARDIKRGPGQYIFNNTLLQGETFVRGIKDLIEEFKNEVFPNKKIMWDCLKMGIASHANLFSIKKTKVERIELKNIRRNLEILEALPKRELTDQIKKQISFLKEKEVEFLNKKVKGAILRAKIPHFENNEVSISHISKLEKLKGEDNTIFSLKDKDGILREGTENVLEIVHDFYSNLYTKEPEDERLQDRLLENISRTLTDEQTLSLEEPINDEEIKAALADLKKNKSPGEDALTKEFYEFFWDELSPVYRDVLKEI